MAEKRYYWLKLQEDFFKSLRIKKLRKLAGGDTFTIIYLKMQLMAMKSEGVLQYKGIEPSFAEELALDMDEDADNVRMTVAYLLNCGLLETSDDKEFFVPYAIMNTGSEGSSTKRVREYRDRKALQCNADETQPKQIGNGEKEIEKEIELEVEEYMEPPVAPPAPPEPPKEVKHKHGEHGWVKLTDAQYNKLLKDLGQTELDRCIAYIDESAQGNHNKNKWSDWNIIIRKCHREGWGLRGYQKQQSNSESVSFWQMREEASRR